MVLCLQSRYCNTSPCGRISLLMGLGKLASVFTLSAHLVFSTEWIGLDVWEHKGLTGKWPEEVEKTSAMCSLCSGGSDGSMKT